MRTPEPQRRKGKRRRNRNFRGPSERRLRFLCAMSFVSAFSFPLFRDIATSSQSHALSPIHPFHSFLQVLSFIRASAALAARAAMWCLPRQSPRTPPFLPSRLAFRHVRMIAIGALARMGNTFSTDQSVRGKRKSIPKQGDPTPQFHFSPSSVRKNASFMAFHISVLFSSAR